MSYAGVSQAANTVVVQTSRPKFDIQFGWTLVHPDVLKDHNHKQPETTRNNQKQPEDNQKTTRNNQKQPETTRNNREQPGTTRNKQDQL